MKEFEAFLAKAIEQKTTLVQLIFWLSVMMTEQLLTNWKKEGLIDNVRYICLLYTSDAADE